MCCFFRALWGFVGLLGSKQGVFRQFGSLVEAPMERTTILRVLLGIACVLKLAKLPFILNPFP